MPGSRSIKSRPPARRSRLRRIARSCPLANQRLFRGTGSRSGMLSRTSSSGWIGAPGRESTGCRTPLGDLASRLARVLSTYRWPGASPVERTPPLPHQAHVTCDQTPKARARRIRWLAGRRRCRPARNRLSTTPWTEMKCWVWPADLNLLICRSRWRAG